MVGIALYNSSKRPLMGKVAAQLSDIVIITDDNPRSEVPAVIRKSVIDGTNDADITLDLFRSSTAYKIISTVTVPADATLMAITKDSAIYLEEGDALRATASVDGDLQVICSYEIISE